MNGGAPVITLRDCLGEGRSHDQLPQGFDLKDSRDRVGMLAVASLATVIPL